MAIDALFLLDFFHHYYLDEKVFGGSNFLELGQEQQQQVQTRTSGVKFTKDAIIRDMMMVENQIPTYVLLRILTIVDNSKPINSSSVEEYLGSMLLSFCEKHCPIKLTHTPSCYEVITKPYHLLDLMYHLVVYQDNEKSKLEFSEFQIPKKNDVSGTPACENVEGLSRSTSTTYDANSTKTISNPQGAPVKFFKIVKVPITWTLGILKRVKDMNLPFMKPIQHHIETILKMSNIELSSLETIPSSEEAPVVVTIPSVCELHSVGIRFQPSKGGIMAIEFDKMKGILYLPVLKLDVNSEVIMRNLVAHEALIKPDFLIFTRYTELMRAIIDTVEDVKLLKEAEIIESSSTLSVEDTEELFNGMSKSIGATKTKKLDDTIKKVNKYFIDKRRGNLYRTFTQYVYSSWRLCTLLATFVLLAMTGLQTFCTVYDCPRHFRNYN